MLLTAAALLAGGAVLAPGAEASTSLNVTVVAGDGEISAAWTAVPGATGYEVRWGSGTPAERVLRTTATSVRIPGVLDHRAYRVQVVAQGVAGVSPAVSVEPVPYVPTSIQQVTARPDGPDRILVQWTGGGQARSVAVIAGADSMLRSSRFSTGWLPAATRSAVLTVPPGLRSVLGAGSGNAVFVKVAQTNSTAPSPAQGLTFSLRDRYRLTPSGTWSLAGSASPQAPVSRLTVASWNVQSITASASFAPADRWAAREPKVVANIEDVAPALIGLQELTTARLEPGCLNHAGRLSCTEQYQSLESALATAPTPYRAVRSDADAWVSDRPDAYVDSALLYDPARLTVVRSGFLSPRTLLGGGWPSTLSDEAGVWAELSTVPAAGGPARSFIAASIHLPAGDRTALRATEAVAVGDALDAQAQQPDGTSLPVVLTGDFNDGGALTPGAGSGRLIAAGWFDAAATPNRTGMRYSTSNGTNGHDGADPGYPAHAMIHPYPTSRIDYILLRRSPYTYRYDNLVRLTPDGRFDPRYQGSDHDLQLADIGIGDPVRP